MNKKTELTPEEEKLMAVVYKEWMDVATDNTKVATDEEIHESILWYYNFAGLEEPKFKIIVDSPMAAQFAVNLMRIMFNSKDNDQIWDQVYDQVYDQVDEQVHKQVDDQVDDQVGEQVRKQVHDQVSKQVHDQLEFTNFTYEGLWNVGWLAFYDFFERIGIVTHEKFKECLKHNKKRIWGYIMLKGICIAVRAPSQVIFKDKKLSSKTEGAVQWSDGYENHFIDGYSIEPEIFNKLRNKKLSAKEALNIQNTEVRRICLQEIGWDQIYTEMNVDILKSEKTKYKLKDNSYYEATEELFEIDLMDDMDEDGESIKARFIKVFDPSKNEFVILRVDPSDPQTKTILGARGSTFKLKKSETIFVKET